MAQIFLFCFYEYLLKGGDYVLSEFFFSYIIKLYFIICILLSPRWIIKNGKSMWDQKSGGFLTVCCSVLSFCSSFEFNLTGIKYVLFPMRIKVLLIVTSNQRSEHCLTMKVGILFSLPLEILSLQGQNAFLREHQGECCTWCHELKVDVCWSGSILKYFTAFQKEIYSDLLMKKVEYFQKVVILIRYLIFTICEMGE